MPNPDPAKNAIPFSRPIDLDPKKPCCRTPILRKTQYLFRGPQKAMLPNPDPAKNSMQKKGIKKSTTLQASRRDASPSNGTRNQPPPVPATSSNRSTGILWSPDAKTANKRQKFGDKNVSTLADTPAYRLLSTQPQGALAAALWAYRDPHEQPSERKKAAGVFPPFTHRTEHTPTSTPLTHPTRLSPTIATGEPYRLG